MPVFVAQIACIVLKRDNRQLQLCTDESRFKRLIEVPIRFLTRNGTSEIRQAFLDLPDDTAFDFQWVDTSYETRQSDDDTGDVLRHTDLKGCYRAIPDAELKQALVDPNWLCNESRKWTAKYRDALEQRVFDELSENYGKVTTDGIHFSFFVRDGTLSSVRGKFVKSAIGLSKSFGTRYLESHQQTRVVHLPAYHRTPVFIFQRDARGTEPDEVEAEEEPRLRTPQKHTVLSWYVRIRKSNLSVPYWGLLRVEVHPGLLPSKGSGDRWSQEDSRIVSAISAAIMAEANPTSQPDARWHNLLYPIRLCEEFARSRMIPHDTVKYLSMSGGKSYD